MFFRIIALFSLVGAVNVPSGDAGTGDFQDEGLKALTSEDECLSAEGGKESASCALSALQLHGGKQHSSSVVSTSHDGGTSPHLPLHTQGRYIVGKHGKRVKLACVNWSGANEGKGVPGGLHARKPKHIALTLKKMGFNCVRLPWSVEMVETNSRVWSDKLLGANRELKGKTTLKILDAVIDALASVGIMVILDNHSSDSIWCCKISDSNGMWYNEKWPESRWIDAHVKLVRRYKRQPWVVGTELRNELRASNNGIPVWGSGSAVDWHSAATRLGNIVLKYNPHLLIIVGGLDFNKDLSGVRSLPVRLNVPNRVVYAAHDYIDFHIPQPTNYKDLFNTLHSRWGFILAAGIAPVWISEFGTFADGHHMVSKHPWFGEFMRYMTDYDVDWAVWRADGTEMGGRKPLGKPTNFGVLAPDWKSPAKEGELLHMLQTIQKPFLGPGVHDHCKRHHADSWQPGWSSGRSACSWCLYSKKCRKNLSAKRWCAGSSMSRACGLTCCRAGFK